MLSSVIARINAAAARGDFANALAAIASLPGGEGAIGGAKLGQENGGA